MTFVKNNLLLNSILLSCIISSFLYGEQEENKQLKPTHEVVVELVLIEVIVTDQKGNFIENLAKKDFEVYEDGISVPIGYFKLINLKEEKPVKIKFEIKEEPIKLVPQKRKLVIVFDSINSFSIYLNREKKEILDILKKLLENNIELMIVEINKNGLNLKNEFTSDRDIIEKSIEQIKGNIWVFYESESYFLRKRVEKTVSSLLSLINFLRKYPEKKSILLISNGIPSLDLQQVMKIFDPFEILPKKNLKDYYRIIDEIIYLSNAENVTFYTFELDGFLKSFLSDMDVTIGGKIEPGKFIDEKIDEIRKTQSILSNFSLAHLADDTGGILFKGDKYDKFSEEISRDLSYYYEIGYKPLRKREDGKYHRIEVKVKRPGLIVRSRKGYADYREEDKIKRNLASAFLSPEYFKDIKFFSEVDAISLGSGRYSIICRMSIPKEQFETLSSEEFTFLLAVKEKDEEKVHMSETKIKIKDELKKDEFNYLFGMKPLKLKPGEYEVKVVLTNKENKIGAWKKIIEISDLKKGKSLKIIKSIPGYLKKSEIKKRRYFTLNEDVSIFLSKYQFFPLMGDKIKKDEKIALFLQIHNPEEENISIKFNLDEGKEIKGNLVEREWREKDKIMNEIYILDFKGIPPGEHRIYLNIIDKNEKAISNFIEIKIEE